MYMMIRQKLSEIKDLNLLSFLLTRKQRDIFLADFDLKLHEQEQVLGVGFWIRDRVKDYLELLPMADAEKSVPFVLMMHQMAFPESKASSEREKLQEWLEGDNVKLYLATGIYFLNHFEGQVEAVTIYKY